MMLYIGLSLVAFLATNASASLDQVLSIHGSGTTNPSKCFWHIMDKIESQTKLPLHMTYRAIGSSNGQTEFVAGVNDFGSGDIPLTNERWQEVRSNGPVLHLPVFVSAVTFFHSVPNTPTLNLTACTLAKIFTRQITNWNDNEIQTLNPEMSVPSGGLPIRVARRVDGSSSTSGISAYLADACPDVWDVSVYGQGSTVNWPEDTLQCEGSGGVTNCIREEAGTIGYIDAGHGHLAGLEEVYIENRAGTKLTTLTSSAQGGIAAAADVEGLMPASPTDDFSQVSLINQPGQYTWPISVMTYIYVKQNLSFMPSASQALLKAFLESLYKGEYADYCVEVFGFTRVDGEALRVAGDAILSLNVTGTPFTFESEEDTLPIDGQGDYIISGKRSSAVEVEFDRLDVSNQQVEQRVRELETRLTQALEVLNLMEQNNAGIGGGGETSSSSSNNQAAAFTDEETKDAEIAAALALSIISIIFSAVIGLGLLCRHFAGGHENKRDLESPH